MHDLYFRLARESKWCPETHPQVGAISAEWRHWLLNRGSLTQRLVDFSDNDFEVKVLFQGWEKPLLHEARELNIPLNLVARIREVELHCHGVAYVFARSVMPLQIFLQQRHVLANIGTRPLGHLLFKDGKMRSSKRSISRYQTSDRHSIFGRSTPYRYADQEILVSEFFINPTLIEKIIR